MEDYRIGLDIVSKEIKKELAHFPIVRGEVEVSTDWNGFKITYKLVNIGKKQETLEKQSYGGTFQKATATEPKKAGTE